MSKLLSTLIAAAFAMTAFGVQAASHAGGAPMKASEPAAAASAAKKDKKAKDKAEAGAKKASDKK